ERLVVAKVTLHQVKPSRQQPALTRLLGIEVGPAISDDERPRKIVAEALQGCPLVPLGVAGILQMRRSRLAIPPQDQRLAAERNPLHLELRDFDGQVAAELDHEVTKFFAARAGLLL